MAGMRSTGSISISVPVAGLQALGKVISEGRGYWGCKLHKDRPLSVEAYAQLVVDHHRGDPECRIDRNKINRLEKAGTYGGFWSLSDQDLAYVAPLTYSHKLGRPWDVAELVAIARGEIDPDQVGKKAHSGGRKVPASSLLLSEAAFSPTTPSMSQTSPRYGLKLLAALMQVSRERVQLSQQQIVDQVNQLTPVSISLQAFNAIEKGQVSSLPQGFIPAIAALEYLVNERLQPYGVAQLLQIAVGALQPVNYKTGQPFTEADLRQLGIESNNCGAVH